MKACAEGLVCCERGIQLSWPMSRVLVDHCCAGVQMSGWLRSLLMCLWAGKQLIQGLPLQAHPC